MTKVVSFTTLLTCILVSFLCTLEYSLASRIVDEILRISNKTKERKDALVSLDQVLDSLERGLDYMWSMRNEVNLDGVIGIRLVEGQLKAFLINYPTDKLMVINNKVKRLENLAMKAETLGDSALNYVRTNEPDYYNRIGTLIEKNFWNMWYPTRPLDMKLVVKPLFEGESMEEADSDYCLAEFFGTTGTTEAQCSITDQCWYLMTFPGYQHYSLSHQVFYLLIGNKMGCFGGDDSKSDVGELTTSFCASMMVEYLTIFNQGFHEDRRDFFMEEQALCGIAGFPDYFRDDWLANILSWQKESGCWGTDSNGRSKREEKALDGGCLSHRTAVALGALVQNIRYITEYMNEII